MKDGCFFCAVGAAPGLVATVFEDDDFVVFLDQLPIREGHVMVIPRDHFDYFDDMPAALAARAMVLAQRVARALKSLYGVERVGLLATGSDLAHAHLHLVPMHEKTDITSARYMAQPPVFARREPDARAVLDPVAARIAKALEAQG